MKTTPLLMTGGNVRLIEQDIKTNTRRVCMARTQNEADIIAAAIMEDIYDADNGAHEIEAWKSRIKCPYGQPGDRLAIKETFWAWGEWFQRPDHSKGLASAMRWEWLDMTDAKHPVIYDCDISEEPKGTAATRDSIGYHKRPSIYLPKTAWRLFLEITRVDVERLQSISEADAIAEGMQREGNGWKSHEIILKGPHKGKPHPHSIVPNNSPIHSYRELWDSINGTKRPGKPDISWAANPMVYSIHFKRIS